MIILVPRKDLPIIRLARVQTTQSGKTWIFDFVDPKHKFAQSMIVFSFLPPEKIEVLYEKLWEKWSEEIKLGEWREGKARVYPVTH